MADLILELEFLFKTWNLDSIDDDVDGRVDGDEEVADVDQHCHPWVPACFHHLLLKEGEEKTLACSLFSRLLVFKEQFQIMYEGYCQNLPGQQSHLLLNSLGEERAHTTPNTAHSILAILWREFRVTEKKMKKPSPETLGHMNVAFVIH